MRTTTLAIIAGTAFGVAILVALPRQLCSAPLTARATEALLHAPDSGPGAGLPLPTAPLSFAPLVEAASPAVVSVYVKQTVSLDEQHMGIPGFPFFLEPGQGGVPEEFEREGAGSGFVISVDGFILTNHHVIEDADEVHVALANGEELTAEVVGADPEIDVALIKVDTDKPLPALDFGSSETLRVGDWVVAIGNPLDYPHTVTAGIVSAKGRVINATTYDDFIQTDASINPGNSGGPLLDTSGQVVGINTAVSRFGQGIAFSVPIDMVKELIDDLKEHGHVARGWLGISMQTVDRDLAAALGLDEPRGALISVVHDDTPAEGAGLRQGDLVLKLDAEDIGDSNDLLHAVGRKDPGDTVSLVVLRNGKRKTIKATLGERPTKDALANGRYRNESGGDDEGEQPGTTSEGLHRLGIELTPADQLRGAPASAHGLLVVTDIDNASPCHGKLQEGDLLLQVGGQDVSSIAEVERALAKADAAVLLTIKRGGVPMFVGVPLGE